jgi:3',5'-cyclic AMP phosphodiesterase CpdA
MIKISTMRKRFFLRAFLLLGGLSLSSCVQGEVALSDYARSLDFRDGFSLLQLTDIHWSYSTDRVKSKAYLNALFSAAKANADSKKIDLILISGDSTMLSSKEITQDLFDFLAGWGVPFTVTWGNHDRQGTYPFSWLESLVSSYKNSLYVPLQDQVDGEGNAVINLNEAGALKWQIYTLDSGSYAQSGTPLRYDYGTLSENQAAWFEKEATLAGKVPSLVFFHIPTRDWQDVYAGGKESKSKWEKNEAICSSEDESPFFAKALANNVKGLFCGHDHSNDLTMTYQGVVLGYGVKTGSELYSAKSPLRTYVPTGTSASEPLHLIGGSLLTLHEGGAFDLDHLYLQDDAAYTLVKERY